MFWSEIGIMNGKSAFLLRFYSNVYNNVFTAFGVWNSFLKAIWRYEAKMHIFEAILLKCIVSSLYSMSNLNWKTVFEGIYRNDRKLTFFKWFRCNFEVWRENRHFCCDFTKMYSFRSSQDVVSNTLFLRQFGSMKRK